MVIGSWSIPISETGKGTTKSRFPVFSTQAAGWIRATCHSGWGVACSDAGANTIRAHQSALMVKKLLVGGSERFALFPHRLGFFDENVSDLLHRVSGLV